MVVQVFVPYSVIQLQVGSKPLVPLRQATQWVTRVTEQMRVDVSSPVVIQSFSATHPDGLRSLLMITFLFPETTKKPDAVTLARERAERWRVEYLAGPQSLGYADVTDTMYEGKRAHEYLNRELEKIRGSFQTVTVSIVFVHSLSQPALF